MTRLTPNCIRYDTFVTPKCNISMTNCPIALIFNLAKQGYCNHFVCLCVCVSVCVSVCPRSASIYIPHNTWNIMILYHEVFLYFLLGREAEGRGGRGREGMGGEGRGKERGDEEL